MPKFESKLDIGEKVKYFYNGKLEYGRVESISVREYTDDGDPIIQYTVNMRGRTALFIRKEDELIRDEDPAAVLIPLESVGSGLNPDTMTVFPMMKDGSYDDSVEDHVIDCDAHWWVSLSKKDLETVITNLQQKRQ